MERRQLDLDGLDAVEGRVGDDDRVFRVLRVEVLPPSVSSDDDPDWSIPPLRARLDPHADTQRHDPVADRVVVVE